MSLSMNDILTSLFNDHGLSPITSTREQGVAVWTAFCRICEENMLCLQNISVPSFGYFGVNKKVENIGDNNGKEKTNYLPSFILSPDFISQYCNTGNTIPSRINDNKTPPKLLNVAVFSSYSGVPGHIALVILENIIRAIGQTLSKGGRKSTLSIEMGFAILGFGAECTNGYNIRWSKSFLKELQDIVDAKGVSHAQTTKANNVIPYPPSRTLKSYSCTPEPHHTMVPKSSQCKQSVVKPFSENNTEYDGSAYTNGQRYTHSSSRCCSELSFRSDASHNIHVHPQKSYGIDDILKSISLRSNTAYEKKKARKRVFRCYRQKAFQESWEKQLALKRQISADEKAMDRRAMDQLMRSVSEQATDEYNRSLVRKAEYKEIMSVNKALSESRKKLQLPRVIPNSDMFCSITSRPSSTTSEALLRQIEENKKKKEKKRIEDIKYHHDLVKLDEEFHKSIAEGKLRAQKQTEEIQKANKKQIEMKKEENKLRGKQEQLEAGSLSSYQDALDDKLRERLADRIRIREFQKENKMIIQQREPSNLQKQKEKYANSVQREEDLGKQVDTLLMERAQLKAKKDSLRLAWLSQIKERQDSKEREKREIEQWKDHCYFRNESSDED